VIWSERHRKHLKRPFAARDMKIIKGTHLDVQKQYSNKRIFHDERDKRVFYNDDFS